MMGVWACSCAVKVSVPGGDVDDATSAAAPIDPPVVLKSPSAASGTWVPLYASSPLATGGVLVPRTPSFGKGDRFKELHKPLDVPANDVSPGFFKQSNSEWKTPATPSFGVGDRFKEAKEPEGGSGGNNTTLLKQANSQWRSPSTPTMGGRCTGDNVLLLY